jgi:hypothetical protein
MTRSRCHSKPSMDKGSIFQYLEMGQADSPMSASEPLRLKKTQHLHLKFQSVAGQAQQTRCLLPASFGPKRKSEKGSPIKRSSVKENTSPGQGNHRFLAEVQRLCCVQPPSEPFLRLCRDVSRVVSVDLRCRSLPHLSPIRIKASAPLRVGPLPHLADQKIFGSMPCPRVF